MHACTFPASAAGATTAVRRGKSCATGTYVRPGAENRSLAPTRYTSHVYARASVPIALPAAELACQQHAVASRSSLLFVLRPPFCREGSRSRLAEETCAALAWKNTSGQGLVAVQSQAAAATASPHPACTSTRVCPYTVDRKKRAGQTQSRYHRCAAPYCRRVGLPMIEETGRSPVKNMWAGKDQWVKTVIDRVGR